MSVSAGRPRGGRPSPTHPNLEPIVVRRPEVQRLLSLGRSSVDELIADGTLESFKAGPHRTSPRLIYLASIRAYVDRLRAAAPAASVGGPRSLRWQRPPRPSARYSQ
jgi:predicted DNA-binding transcriptional regulator AlpA